MPIDINLLREDRGGNPELVKESQRRRFAPVELVDQVRGTNVGRSVCSVAVATLVHRPAAGPGDRLGRVAMGLVAVLVRMVLNGVGCRSHRLRPPA